MKQKTKAKICFVIYIPGKRIFFIYDVIVKQNKKKALLLALQQRVDTGQAKGNLRGVLCKKGQAHQMDAEKKKMTGIEKRNIRRGRPREAKIFDKSNR